MKKFTTTIANTSTSHALHSLSTTIKSLITQNHLPKALKLTIQTNSPIITDQTYSHFIKKGHVLNTYLCTTLISHFTKRGDFHRSFGFLSDTQYPNIVSFNVLLSGYAQFGKKIESFLLFNKLSVFGVRPDRYSLSSLIKVCDSVTKLKVAHVVCVKFGFDLCGVVVSGLIFKYGKFGCVREAEMCFESCFLGLDVVGWTAMINGYVWNFEFGKAKEVFVGMRKVGLGFNEFTLTAIVGALREVREGEQIHGFGVKTGLLYSGSVHLCNVLMNMYARCGSRVNAGKMFDEIPAPEVVSWSARIGLACDGGEAFEVFRFMHSNGLEMNEVTIINVLSAIEEPGLLIPGKLVHSVCHRAGYLSTLSVGNSLVSMYGKCCEMDDARLVFDEMGFHDSVSWNALIRGYCEGGLMSSALLAFSQMRDSGFKPDQYALASILGAVSNPSFNDVVMQLHSLIIKTALTSDDSMASCLISSYSKCSNLNYSKRVFYAVDEVNEAHLQVMAASAIAAGYPADALECCISAASSWSEVHSSILSIMLKACSILTNLSQGSAIHCLALKSGNSRDRFVESAIVDFYCKSGSIADADNVFADVSSHNLAAWNAMIMGYAQHGCYEKVLSLFRKMTDLGTKPDEITYLGLLQSCCHVGLVNEAKFHLNSMFELHGVVPCLEHYASLVDLLGRVGLVDEAKLIIDQMPVSPDAQVWQSLLSGCHSYGNLELAEVAARELLKFQPDNDSAYVLLSNLYARAEDWDAVRRLRKEMKDKSIFKEPGSSWIEVGGIVCNFLVQDNSHPLNENIYFYLKTLYLQMVPQSKSIEDPFVHVAGF